MTIKKREQKNNRPHSSSRERHRPRERDSRQRERHRGREERTEMNEEIYRLERTRYWLILIYTIIVYTCELWLCRTKYFVTKVVILLTLIATSSLLVLYSHTNTWQYCIMKNTRILPLCYCATTSSISSIASLYKILVPRPHCTTLLYAVCCTCTPCVNTCRSLQESDLLLYEHHILYGERLNLFIYACPLIHQRITSAAVWKHKAAATAPGSGVPIKRSSSI